MIKCTNNVVCIPGIRMSDEAPFCADLAPTNRAGCKKCKQKIEKGSLRLAKLAANPFGDGTMKMWHHVGCLFEAFKKQRVTTARINSPDDIGGWNELSDGDKEEILKHLPDDVSAQARTRPSHPPVANSPKKSPKKGSSKGAGTSKNTGVSKEPVDLFKDHKDNSFREFRRLCADMSNESSYTGKTALVKALFDKGSDGSGFKGDVGLWCRLLLPGAVKRVYNLQSRQLCKLLARVLRVDPAAMLADLEQGDVAETVRVAFEGAKRVPPATKSRLTLSEVDEFLCKLAELTREDDQAQHFQDVVSQCTSNDLKMLVRLVKHDLRINAGPKHVLAAVHPTAYQAFQTSRDIDAVLSRCLGAQTSAGAAPALALMTPVQPMLAAPCRAAQDALAKCPHGLCAEVKYDGERVQVHKRGADFRYFSRSLKPVLAHKVAHFSSWLPAAFPAATDLVLDAEVLMVDTHTGLPLPFGTLGKHKQAAFADANVCLFVFDCLLLNGDSLLDRPLSERRSVLTANLTEVPNRVVLSELHEIRTVSSLESLITRVLRQGLEGLVLKDPEGTYKPGARHWLKVKRDYLMGGAMADSVDLLVLGAWFGTGAKGGMMSSFLMGVRADDGWRTVTKVHGGLDDAALTALQSALSMERVGRDPARCPSWLVASRTMVPDLVAKDPAKMPVWEVTGAEFTQHEVHTADGISIRFPRVTRVRDDKDHRSATSLAELRIIFAASRDTASFALPSSEPNSEDKLTPKKNAPDSDDSDTDVQEEVTPKKKANLEATPKKHGTPESSSRKRKSGTTPKPKGKADSGLSSDGQEKEFPNSKNIKLKVTTKPKVKADSDSDSDLKEEAALKNKEKSHTTPKKKLKHEATPSKQSTKSEAVPSSRAIRVPSRPLPSFLNGVAVVLPPEGKNLRRHLAAAGGTALPASDACRSSHVLHSDMHPVESVKWPNGARQVRLAWLEDSIKLQARQPERRYVTFRNGNNNL